MTATHEPRKTPSPEMPRARAGASARTMATTIGRTERPRILITAAAGGALGLALGGLFQGWAAALILGVLGALAAGWWQRGRGTAARWRRGALGEQRTGRLLRPLERRGWTVLHDRRLPGTRANVDHLLVSPDGSVYNVDSKHRRGAVRWDNKRQYLRIGNTSGYTLVKSTVFESERIAEALRRGTGRTVPVVSVLAVHNARLPHWHTITIKGVRVLNAGDLRRFLKRRTIAPTEQGREVAELATRVFKPYVQEAPGGR